MKKYYFIIILIFICCITACKKVGSEQPNDTTLGISKSTIANKDLAVQLKNSLEGIDSTQTIILHRDSLFATSFVVKFYAQHKYIPVWFNAENTTLQNNSLYQLIKNADEYGLIPTDYHIEEIDSLLQLINKKKASVKTITEAELLLTDAFFTLSVHVNKGRLNKDSLIRGWNAQLVEINLVQVLINALKNNAIKAAIDSLEPHNVEYKVLKTTLQKFLTAFKNSNNDSVFYRNSDFSKFKQYLEKKIVYTSNYAKGYTIPSSIYQNQQQLNNRHFKVSGMDKLNYITFQETVQQYIRQIELNMERWRYYAKPTDSAYAWINIPSYQMRIIEKDSTVLHSRVIVGRPENPTPILHSTIKYFLIYPYWNVPYKIATHEILPILKRDSNYLNRKNFEVLDNKRHLVSFIINWKKYSKDYFPWMLRQRIGNENSLGIIKFNFNNKYGVYLHDTNNRSLFELENRAISHGCMRLEKFKEFAFYLIRNQQEKYSDYSLICDLSQEKQKYVYLKYPLPIYTNYFTIEVNKNHELIYIHDIYKKDKKMLHSLYKAN